MNSYRYFSERKISKLPNVAHAGGLYRGSGYTNSLESLNENKRKYEYFEIDFMRVSDGHIVCAHDWGKIGRNLALGDGKEGIPSLDEFLTARKKHQWTACTLDELVEWVKENDKFIVTDIKENNIENLKFIKNNYPDMLDKFIPQIYNTSEYFHVKAMGYKKIIFTLYATNISDIDLVDWINGKEIFAVTMWHHRTPYLTKKLNDMGYAVYAHTINDKNIFDFLRKNYGIQGIYTDTLGDSN